ncbi:endothelin-converting enzyme homolog [Gordionus sp. m RMFG-2023]|uniref:endothelin-converting enzyme homolog n=1 Tax=Gordionus sp. m RMFG-2023 TaxID=3053472 RepID=UPI0031FE312C
MDPLDFNKNVFALSRLHNAVLLGLVINQNHRYFEREQMAYDEKIHYDTNRNKIYITYQTIDASVGSQKSRSLTYGALGTALAHELFHSLDSTGIDFDEEGVRREWITPATKQLIKEKMKCFIHNQSYTFNGKIVTKGENQLEEIIADSSLKLAYKVTTKIPLNPLPTYILSKAAV